MPVVGPLVLTTTGAQQRTVHMGLEFLRVRILPLVPLLDLGHCTDPLTQRWKWEAEWDLIIEYGFPGQRLPEF